MAKKTDAVTTAIKDVTWPRIYVGPSIPKGYFKSNMVFADGLGTVARELVEKLFQRLTRQAQDYTALTKRPLRSKENKNGKLQAWRLYF